MDLKDYVDLAVGSPVLFKEKEWKVTYLFPESNKIIISNRKENKCISYKNKHLKKV